MALGSMFPVPGLFGGGMTGRANQVRPNIPDMYKASLKVVRDGSEVISIKTQLPENFSFSLSTSWDNPFNQPVSNFASGASGGYGQAVDAATTGVTAATGFTTLNKWLSAGVWTGGSMFQIDLPFVIQAFENTKDEVVKPMRDLLKLVAPSEYEGKFLKAPGPLIGSPFSGGVRGDEITVTIGNFFVMTPCIIESVTETFDTQLDVNGDPIGVTINVSVKSFFTTTKEDIDKFFAPSLGG